MLRTVNLRGTASSWQRLGKRDPLFAVLTHKGKEDGRWNREEFFATGVREVEEMRAYLRSRGIALPAGAALDFGCGVGRLTQALTPYFETVHGVDIAPSMIAHARAANRTDGKCVFHVNAAPDLRLFPDGAFSFVYSKITLQHMEPRYAEKFIREFFRVLRRGGLAVFQVPSGPSPRLMAYEAAAARSLRRRIKMLFPAPVRATYDRVKHALRPMIEMYAIPKERILTLIAEAGGATRAAREDANAGENWLGVEYVAERRG